VSVLSFARSLVNLLQYLLKCFVRLLEVILSAGQQFLNDIHISRPAECQLKMTNVQGDEAQENEKIMVKIFRHSSTKTVGEQSVSS
jgi:hypothetical protein